MNTLFALLLSFSSALATEVGDFERHEGYLEGEPVVIETEVVEYDPGGPQFKVVRTTWRGNEAPRIQTWWSTGFITPDEVYNLLVHCEEIDRAKRETIQLKFATLETCKIWNGPKSHFNAGKVPFGTVRATQELASGGFQITEVTAARYGRGPLISLPSSLREDAR